MTFDGTDILLVLAIVALVMVFFLIWAVRKAIARQEARLMRLYEETEDVLRQREKHGMYPYKDPSYKGYRRPFYLPGKKNAARKRRRSRLRGKRFQEELYHLRDE